ncbi:holin [uncultured Pseudoramibacter sp.]|jgi:phage-related tail protein|uniref:holin n=1 Tax=uncultured Pseudoramibacter sp. TaxID=1623493 RepID=UPI0025F967CF|nr:holin [uncultured Pseudoramibacter sp.]
MKKISRDGTRAWLAAAGRRAARTFAQTLAASLMTASGITDAPWRPALSAAALAALISMLTSLTGLPELDRHQVKNGGRPRG